MSRFIDARLDDVTALLASMGGYLEQALELSTQAWRTRAIAKCHEVYLIEEKVNRVHLEIDARCVELLALQSPMAADLRYVVSLIRMNADLERMADLAVNIANNTEYYLRGPGTISIASLSHLAGEVGLMVREVLNAFVAADGI